ncbi:hypothetical protein ND748_03595 [Frankia sp. AiPs1]|nr:hypothetical protein [Frankia sp. AiPs1]MCM3920761.1 hypothetical protein [Frankia sp. AiPs1]
MRANSHTWTALGALLAAATLLAAGCSASGSITPLRDRLSHRLGPTR